MAELAIVVPTISGREHWLERCLAAYDRWTPAFYVVEVVKDEPTCGRAWNLGLARALERSPEVRFVHLTADDIEPLEGWYDAGVDSVLRREFPAPLILNPDGTLQSCGDERDRIDGEEVEIARIPFATRAQMECVGPIIETHYYTDNYFSHRGRVCGVPSRVNRRYSFVHHFAQEGRKDALLASDHRAYKEATR